jgi:hypothetical protein
MASSVFSGILQSSAVCTDHITASAAARQNEKSFVVTAAQQPPRFIKSNIQFVDYHHSQ